MSALDHNGISVDWTFVTHHDGSNVSIVEVPLTNLAETSKKSSPARHVTNPASPDFVEQLSKTLEAAVEKVRTAR